jgi:hypothetical protein
MKKIFVILSVTFLFITTWGINALAHPGATDSMGGHTCKKDCGKWGLEIGEYHYHDKESSRTTYNILSQNLPHADIDTEEKMHRAKNAGHELGYSLADLVFPSGLYTDETVKKEFESQYRAGFEKRMKEERDKHKELGNKDGFDMSEPATESLDINFVDAYKEGYEEGRSKRKKETLEEGYQSAFTNVEYQETEAHDDQQLANWYKEGFESNEIAMQIKKEAFENGLRNSRNAISEEFQVNPQSIALYDSSFQRGQEMRNKKKQQKMLYTIVLVIPASCIAIGGYIVKRRK